MYNGVHNSRCVVPVTVIHNSLPIEVYIFIVKSSPPLALSIPFGSYTTLTIIIFIIPFTFI